MTCRPQLCSYQFNMRFHQKGRMCGQRQFSESSSLAVFQKATKNQAAIAPYYPSGSLVNGVAAALITYCQLRALEAELLMSWPNTEYNSSPPVSFGFDECVSTRSSKPCGHRRHCCGKIDSREDITCRFRALHAISCISLQFIAFKIVSDRPVLQFNFLLSGSEYHSYTTRAKV